MTAPDKLEPSPAERVVELIAKAINRSSCVDDADAEMMWSSENIRHNRTLEAIEAMDALRRAGYVICRPITSPEAGEVMRLTLRAEAAEARAEKMRAALMPFAKLKYAAGHHAPDYKVIKISVTAAELRAAALAADTDAGEGK